MTNTPPATIHLGDCIEVMRALPENSVDAIVTDPPYGLGFMGKAWDELPPGEGWARECLRVLKPGGHLLAFGGSRTWHRLAVAVEDAGFEVRDSIAWLYGSGFPKSLDVSKAIDKARTEDKGPTRVVCRAIRAAMDVRDLRSRHLVEHFDGCHPRLIDHWAARDTDSQPALPTWEQWETLCDLFPELSEHDAEVWRLNGRKGTPGEAWDQREVVGQSRWDNSASHFVPGEDHTQRVHLDITAPATDDARKWAGFGTALKPAFEPIVVARKPIAGGTVAANVLAHGTGALNIDGCRVGLQGEKPPTGTGGRGASSSWDRQDGGMYDAGRAPTGNVTPTAGRWPANVVLDESQAAALDQMSGYSKSPTKVTRGSSRASTQGATHGGQSGGYNYARQEASAPGDSGGASRFFYVAKAPTRERPKVDGVAHPTVKPLALMRWLVRLVTPPGGTVLEPFAGSGTTVEACALEGFACIAIEREPDYLPLIQARLARVEAAQPEPVGPSLFDMEETA